MHPDMFIQLLYAGDYEKEDLPSEFKLSFLDTPIWFERYVATIRDPSGDNVLHGCIKRDLLNSFLKILKTKPEQLPKLFSQRNGDRLTPLELACYQYNATLSHTSLTMLTTILSVMLESLSSDELLLALTLIPCEFYDSNKTLVQILKKYKDSAVKSKNVMEGELFAVSPLITPSTLIDKIYNNILWSDKNQKKPTESQPSNGVSDRPTPCLFQFGTNQSTSHVPKQANPFISGTLCDSRKLPAIQPQKIISDNTPIPGVPCTANFIRTIGFP